MDKINHKLEKLSKDILLDSLNNILTEYFKDRPSNLLDKIRGIITVLFDNTFVSLSSKELIYSTHRYKIYRSLFGSKVYIQIYWENDPDPLTLIYNFRCKLV